ncbi:MAG TPA: antitoxin Xre/MbcA/ParS toxin-binding domain-containing protein [Xanthobacteraceae bacterium]|nr:antitoxin Xre/MbcA/ParS toxin-binding domain-containing protein [Xanthobacteraceae bacterium]
MVAQAVADKIPAARQQLAMAGFFGIMDRWRVSNVVARRILGFPPERTFFEWKRGKAGRVPDDTLRRIGYVAGIWKALEILYSDPSAAEDWVNRPNDFFGGQSPLERMAAGDVTDLAAVRAYVDAARAPWS